jgi:apolipoprotein N-acyltransferase
MQNTEHRYTLSELWSHCVVLARQAPPGICVFTEGSLPAYLRLESSLQTDLSRLAKGLGLDLVVGSIDQDGGGHPYNSAYGITAHGRFLGEIYHKRYLVPFGEYTPLLVNYFPEFIKRLTNTPVGCGYTAGKQPVVLNLSQGKVAPLICFETLSPELVASSVRKGGQLLVNISDLAWFHRSICGEQMIAFSVLRAVENRRYFIFAANTGPSAIIDPNGYIRRISPLNQADVLTGKIGFNAQITPFTRWFVF